MLQIPRYDPKVLSHGGHPPGGRARWSGQVFGARDVDALPASDPTAVLPSGSDPLQFGQLRVPEGQGPFLIAIVIHGGCWTKGYVTLTSSAPIASELARQGVATWNFEYRQVGDAGGGWPGSFQDWAAADHATAAVCFGGTSPKPRPKAARCSSRE